MQASLVMAPLVDEVVGEVVKTPQFTHPQKRALAPTAPVASATVQGCGVGGLATAAAMTARVTRLVSWARANWGQDAAGAIELIARDTGTSLSIPQQAVSEEFELALHAALVGDLPDTAIRFLVVSGLGSLIIVRPGGPADASPPCAGVAGSLCHPAGTTAV